MKKRLCLTVMAAIILSLVIPICGAPAVKAAAKTPGKVHMPDLVQLWPWENTIYFENIQMPQNAKSVQVYLRTTGKKVKTVKKNSYWHKKYKKNKKKYIIVKAKRKNRYNVYKAGKWKVILTTSEENAQCVKPLKAGKIYQIKFRGKNGKKLGKSSRILQFRNLTKKQRKECLEEYNENIEWTTKRFEEAEANLGLPDDPDSYLTRQEEYDEAKYVYDNVKIKSGYVLYIEEGLGDGPFPEKGTDIYHGMESEGKLL